MAYYPIFLEMKGRPVLVVGGGRVGEDKVRGLLAAGADVMVVSPDLTPSLRELQVSGAIRHIQRPWTEADLDGFQVVIVATDDGAINGAVAAAARRKGVWVNAVDDPPNCDFILPAVIRKGSVTLAASTGGASPAMARRLREELEVYLDADIPQLNDLLGEVRAALRARGIRLPPETWQSAIDARVRALLAQNRIAEARERLLEGLGVEARLLAQAPASRDGTR
jgi:precorrin-2 dehydrogenase/sirohydrochlorin ferrochelatase